MVDGLVFVTKEQPIILLGVMGHRGELEKKDKELIMLV